MRVAHYLDRIRAFERGERVAPITINVDPTSRCNLKCEWCNSWRVRGGNLDFGPAQLDELSRQIDGWGVQTACISGGGEPLLSPYLPETFDLCERHHLPASFTTNGTLPVPTFVLTRASWVAFSVDAATRTTYKRLKGVDRLLNVAKNIENAVKTKHSRGLTTEISFKYLIYPGNEHEIPAAYQLALDLGVDRFHIRPVSDRSTEHGALPLDLSWLDRIEVDPRLPVSKVGFRFDLSTNTFPRCLSWMAATITTSGQVGFCSNQKGWPPAVVCDLEHFREEWCGPRHRALMAAITPATCPKCPYTLDLVEMSSLAGQEVWI